jgi:thymidylate kinase
MADRVLLVAIDGPDAAGKTTLADALAARIAGEMAGARETGWRPPLPAGPADLPHCCVT